MSYPWSLVENMKIVRVLNVTACNAFTLSDYISCKNAHKVWFVISHYLANDTDITIGLTEATSVAGGSAAAVVATVPIWVDIDHGTASDDLVRQTDAATYAIDPATAGSALLVMEWDPAKFTAGFDCIAVSGAGAGGHANNRIVIFALIAERYQQATPPSAIVD
jgi:hypothetical protein